MAKKPKAPDAGPSKAYLVSFGDTMTALLAFFIVINSLSKEQTGANVYAGTGSFVNAINSIGTPGGSQSDASKYITQKEAPSPLYALAENLDKNSDDTIGPDDVNEPGRTIDRDSENFLRFLAECERQFGLQKEKAIASQVVFDSFQSFDIKTGLMSKHALHLAAETIPLLQNDQHRIEIIIWATMPSSKILDKMIDKSVEIQQQIEDKFWIQTHAKNRLRVSVKPWLFSDAKRPVISFVVAKTAE